MLSKRIACLRKSKGISQSQLASFLNVSPSTIGMYEQGRRCPDLITIIALADIFEVSLDYLITGSESKHIRNEHPVCPCASCCRAQK